MDLQELKKLVKAKMPRVIEALIEVITSPDTPPRDKIKAFEALADRIGLPQVKAQLSGKMAGLELPEEDLKKREEELRAEEERLEFLSQTLSLDGLEELEDAG